MRLTVYECTRPFAAVALRFLCSYEHSNRKRKLPDGPLIVVSNHLSWLDIPLIGLGIPRQIAFIAKKEYFHSPFHRRLVDLYGGFTVDRGAVDGTALKKAFEILDQGGCLGIFPEGTRSKTFQLQQGHVGTAFIALHKNVYILPIGIYGTEKIRHKFESITHILYRPKVVVNIGEPFKLPDVHGHPTRRDREVGTEIIMRKIAELLPESYRGVYRDNADHES
ncbi:MAG: lysophospholipid acyltransferase family protein [Dehalococcoidia bacterium]|nr:lysophospholipid acyltransferase family protein [Dehalococcoidia bacterium]